MKYLYVGETPISMGKYGTVSPGDVVNFASPNFMPLPEASAVAKSVGTPYQITADDYGFVLHVTHDAGPGELTLPSSLTIPGGWYIEIADDSAGVEWPCLVFPNDQQLIKTTRTPVVAKTMVRGGGVTNLSPSLSPPAAFGVPVVAGDVALLASQVNPAENGPYFVPAIATAVASCTRTPLPDLNTRMNGLAVKVGPDNDVWLLAPNGIIVPGTTPLKFRLAIHGATGAAELYAGRPQIGLLFNGQDWLIVQSGS